MVDELELSKDEARMARMLMQIGIDRIDIELSGHNDEGQTESFEAFSSSGSVNRQRVEAALDEQIATGDGYFTCLRDALSEYASDLAEEQGYDTRSERDYSNASVALRVAGEDILIDRIDISSEPCENSWDDDFDEDF